MNISVFYLSHPAKYYLRHPLKFFSSLWKILKRAYQRVTRGWCDMDAWEMDNWFITIAPQMIRKIAVDGWGYPGIGKWDTPEKWNSYLFSLADMISGLSKESIDAKNKYYKKYMDSFTLHEGIISTKEDYDIGKEYFDEHKRLIKERDDMKKEAFDMLCECFDLLWD